MEWSQPSSTTIFGENKEEAHEEEANEQTNGEEHSSFGSSSF